MRIFVQNITAKCLKQHFFRLFTEIKFDHRYWKFLFFLTNHKRFTHNQRQNS